MASALYRRYRPVDFSEVVAQEHVTGPLLQALRTGRVHHAYLFSGPRGCGKTTSARILARCLNCHGADGTATGPVDRPCGQCPSCKDLGRGGAGSLDVVEIDAASHGGVDDARELRERVTFAPVRDRYKVFVIDEAHMVSPAGFNALLKTVEEPPEHVVFVFATTEPDKVLTTIRSRTHHYPFHLVPPAALLELLERVCAKEGVPVGKGVLPLVVRAGAGSVRDSLSVLDQLVAGSGEEGIDYECAVALLGYTHAALLDDVVEALAARDGATVFRVVDRVIESGHDPRRFVEDLLERLRDLVIAQAVGEGLAAVLRGQPEDQLDRIRGQASRFGPAELSRAADLCNAALTEMTGATSPRLHLELLCARVLLPAADGDGGLGARVDRIERRLGVPVQGARSSGRSPGSAPQPVGTLPAPPSDPSEPGQPGPLPGQPSPEPDPAREPGPIPSPEPDPTREPGPIPSPEPVPGPGPGPTPEPSPQPMPAPSPMPGPVPEPAPSPEPLGRQPERSAPDEPAAVAPGRPTAAGPAAAGPAAAGPAVTAAGPDPDTETVRRMWPDILDRLKALKRMTWSTASEYAHVHDVRDGVLRLAFTNSGALSMFARGAHTELVRQAVIDVLGLDVRVEAVPAAASAVPPTPAAPSPTAVEDWGSPSRPPEAEAAPAAQPEPDPEPPTDAGLRSAADSDYVGSDAESQVEPAADPGAEREIGSGTGAAAGGTPGGASGARGGIGAAAARAAVRQSRGSGGGAQRGNRGALGGEAPGPGGSDQFVATDEDVPSLDDEDAEDSGLVGPPVVEQLLGGRVIEIVDADRQRRG